MPRCARQLDDEIHHRLLGRDVEAGGRLVGDQELRIAGERERNDDALAHAARQLERIGVIALARTARSGPAPALRSPSRRDPRASPGHAASSTSSICWPTLRIGLSAARGFWKIIEISRPRRSRISRSLAALHVDAGKHDRAVRDAAGAIEDAHHGVGRDGFAGAGFADDAERLALLDGDVDVLHRAHDAAPGGEFDGQVFDIEQRLWRSSSLLTSAAAGRRCRAGRRPEG